MSQTLTIQLSDVTYHQLHQLAALERQPVDVIIEHSLTHSLPPLLDEIPQPYQPDVFPLLLMTDAELQAEARQQMSPARWEVYETLLEKKKDAALTATEETQLARLNREADVLTFRKGYAAVLLKRRTGRAPTLGR